MSMTQAQFEKLVKKLDKIAYEHPQKYKLRVKLLANLGYAYIILLVILSLGLIGFLIYYGMFSPLQIFSGVINLLLVFSSLLPLTFALIVLKSVKVYFPKPKGLELKRQEAPGLFALIDELISILQTPKYDHILLTGELNAGVVQRLSFLKLQETYLLLGLLLMYILSLDQFRAVLAHELGHLSRNHTQLQGRIYLVRRTWYQVWERLQELRQGSVFIPLLSNWDQTLIFRSLK